MEISSFLKKRKIGIILSYIYFALNTIISIFISGFVVRTVGKTDYGVYQTMSAFAGYLILLEFGTGTVMTRNISICKKGEAHRDELQKNISTIWSFSVVLSVLITFFSILFYYSIDKIYNNSLSSEQITFGKHLFIYVTIALIFNFLSHTLNGIVLGHEYYSFEKLISTIKLFIRTTLVVVLLTIKPSVFIIVVIDACMSIFGFIITFLFCVFKIGITPGFRQFSLKVFKIIVPLCLTMLLQTIATTINGSVDKFLIGIMLKPEDVTTYTISMGLFSMFSSIATLPVTLYMPKTAAGIRDGMTSKDIENSLFTPCRLNMFVTGILAFGIITVGQQFIQIVYGTEYKEAWIYAILVIIPMFLAMSNAVIINVLDVFRKRHLKTFITFGTIIVNLLLTIIGLRYIGLVGAAAATGFATLVDMVLVNLLYAKKFKINAYRLFFVSAKGIFTPLLIATIICFPVRYIFNNIYYQFLIGGFGFCIIFALLFIVFGTNDDEKQKIKLLKLKLLRKNKRIYGGKENG
ncbi:MAG: oligosaccharide flippase family protein [Acutalibacteraceae bacterium]|nr:oligosaccharide flippase family protein [Acutalibacteraceae bacterium]